MASPSSDPILLELDELLAKKGTIDWQAILASILKRMSCVVGTIHVLHPKTQVLELICSRGIPAAILEQVSAIPMGKGMAGIAAERREPVQVCNLQKDSSGVAKPNAKLTKMEGTIACPMFAGTTLRGTLGVAKPTAYEFSQAEINLLMAIGQRLALATEPGSD